MKKWFVLLSGVILLVGLSACGSSEEEKKDYSETNSTIKETESYDKAEFMTLAAKHIEELFGISGVTIETDASVNQFPDDKNAETGEEYKNVLNGIGNFVFEGKSYPFSFMYSKKDDTTYNILYLYSNYDSTKEISVPLESD
ncbi:hypothetical protein [Enterococcus sp. BWR-S5]|uniref:hypothetical protein n=1 Tax=Enterococcus sp. BWR-S5 TaxID=2787714 RepID=UPI0019229388|nr:hypothetical protein [Enterococcus sp. BWR-S5]MBL1223707.1 hypothetical protein [Enterococcus sp. BWR-S5]